jgi:hypothetical protein
MSRRGYPVASNHAIVAMLRSGRRLLKTFGTRGPLYVQHRRASDELAVAHSNLHGAIRPRDCAILENQGRFRS